MVVANRERSAPAKGGQLGLGAGDLVEILADRERSVQRWFTSEYSDMIWLRPHTFEAPLGFAADFSD